MEVGPKCNHVYHKREGDLRGKHMQCQEGNMNIEQGEMQPQAKKCQQSPEAGRGKEHFPFRASRGSTTLPTSWISNIWLLEFKCEKINLCCFKPPSLL